jgi:hypothetical protein
MKNLKQIRHYKLFSELCIKFGTYGPIKTMPLLEAWTFTFNLLDIHKIRKWTDCFTQLVTFRGYVIEPCVVTKCLENLKVTHAFKTKWIVFLQHGFRSDNFYKLKTWDAKLMWRWGYHGASETSVFYHNTTWHHNPLPWRWRQNGSLKRRYLTITLHGVKILHPEDGSRMGLWNVGILP